MAKLGISTGTTPNDGTGDSLLAGAVKINSNFDEIYNKFGDGTNLTAIGGTWTTNSVGIHTLKNVGIGTTNPRFALEVGAVGASGTSLWVNGNARITGILTIGTASITLNGSTNRINVGSGVTIDGSTGIISATSIVVSGTTLTGAAVTYITAGSGISVDQSTGNVTITATGGGGGGGGTSSQWATTTAGIHTLSNVGIGTTNPTSRLTVRGTSNLENVTVSGVSTFSNNVRVSGIVTANTIFVSDNGSDNGSLLIDNVSNAYTELIWKRSDTGANGPTIRGIYDVLNIDAPNSGFISLGGSTANAFYNGGNVILNNDAQGTTFLANGLGVVGISTFTYIKNTGITSTKEFIVSGTGNDVGSAATISLRSRNNYVDFDAAIPNTSPPQQFGIKFQGNTILGGSYTFPSGNIQLNNWNGNSAIAIDDNGVTLSGITTVTGQTLFTKQLSISGVSTAGIITGATYYGDASNAVDGRWTLGANGTSDYTFTGIGFTQTTNDPVLYLARGRVYEFVNNSGGSHPFQIRSSNGGAAYNDGVTNNGSASGTIRFEVPFGAPNTLYYQCTNHSGMGATIFVTPRNEPAVGVRTTVTATTGSVGAANTTNLDINGFKTYSLLKVGITSAAWVVLYTDPTSRTNDASRSYLTDPTPGSGVIAEVRSTSAGISTFIMSPGVIGWNNDVSVASTIYARVTNNESSTSTGIGVTLTVVKLED